MKDDFFSINTREDLKIDKNNEIFKNAETLQMKINKN